MEKAMSTRKEKSIRQTPLTRRDFIKTTAVGGAACLFGPAAVRAAGSFAASVKRKPNFVIIFIDDLGYSDIEPFGQKIIRTPNLNRMAAEGMKFTDFYSAAPVCTPSRAALMTGCYPTRVTMARDDRRVLFHDDKCGLNPKEVTIAEILKNQSYATMCVGKWHLGHRPEFLPTRQGFDHYFGIPYSNDMEVDPEAPLADDVKLGEGLTPETFSSVHSKEGVVPLYRDEKLIEYPVDQTQITKRYTEKSIEFIVKNKDRPFFLYLPHTMVHEPLHASEAFKGRSRGGLYGDCVEEIDWSIGQILDTLCKNGLAENTFVLFTSDNGQDGHDVPPLRDSKGSTYEGGMREPTIMWWPGTIRAGSVCKEVTATIDMLPTIAGLAGASAPKDRIIDGHDITALIKSVPGAKSEEDKVGFYYYNDTKLEAIRLGKWKLRKAANEPDAPVELYDLAEDMGEKNNLAEKEPAMVERLMKMMQDFDRELWANQRPCALEGGGESKVIPLRPCDAARKAIQQKT
jgi:arylsulfatase A